MRQCEHCGSELRASARFCGRCGKRVDSEIEATTNSGDSPIVDVSVSPLTPTVVFNESQDAAPEDDVEEEGRLPQLVLEEDVEDEQTDIPGLSSSMSADPDVELEGTGDHKGPPDHSAPPSLLREDIAAEKMESPANQVLDEHPQFDQAPVGQLAALSAGVSERGVKARSSSVPKVLLFLVAVLIIASGCAAALVGLFHWHLPGTGEAASALSSSSVSETVNTSGQPLNATVCAGTPTRATPGTSSGIGLTLSTPSGCSSFNIASATSMCLIFPYNPGALHKYILNVSNVTVNSKAYHLVLSIAGYSGSSSYNDGDHVSIGIGEGSTGVNFSWLYRSGNVTINSDEQSGTMDVIMESASGGNTIHVVGGWMCGRLIKIK